jgi:hypothetical protein
VRLNQLGADNSFATDHPKNELRFGKGGVDDAEDAEVILHEYGHAIHFSQKFSSTSEEAGAISEGFGDYWALAVGDVVSKALGIPAREPLPCVRARRQQRQVAQRGEDDSREHMRKLVSAVAYYVLSTLMPPLILIGDVGWVGKTIATGRSGVSGTAQGPLAARFSEDNFGTRPDEAADRLIRALPGVPTLGLRLAAGPVLLAHPLPSGHYRAIVYARTMVTVCADKLAPFSRKPGSVGLAFDTHDDQAPGWQLGQAFEAVISV